MEPRIGDFVEKTIQEIQNGLPKGFKIEGCVRFDVSVITTMKKSGGVSIRILIGDVGKESQTVHHIGFTIANTKRQRTSVKQSMRVLHQSLHEIASVADDADRRQGRTVSTSSRLIQSRQRG